LSGRTRVRGVTLLELVLVMMIIFTLATVVAPRFSDFFPALQVRSAAAALLATAGKARADAVLTGVRHRLIIDTETRSYWIALEAHPVKEPGKFEKLGGAWVDEELPRDVVLETIEGFGTEAGTRRYLEFRSDGTASAAASVVLANDRGDRRTVTVAAATGAVKIEDGGAAP
jgi:Tfp pilus assembly protein FimT